MQQLQKYKKTELGKIPEEWQLKQFIDIAGIKGGKRLPLGDKFSETKTVYPYLRVCDFKHGNIDKSNLKFLTEKTYKKIKNYTITHEDVYISIAGTIGLTGLIPKELDGANLTENAAKITNLKNIQKEYIVYLFNSSIIQKQIQSYIGQLSQPKLALFRIEKLKVPLPPLEEQRKIVSILSNIDELIQKTEQIIVIKKKIFRSVMKEIFSEKLIISDRKNENSTSTIKNIGSVAHVTKLAGFEYTKHIVLSDNGDIPVIRAQNVRMGKFVSQNIKYIPKKVSDFLVRSQTNGGEVLMVFIGACGDTCLAPTGRWHLGPNVAKIDCKNIDSEYLCYFLQSPIGVKNTLSWMKSTAQPSLSMETIRKINVIVFPHHYQKKIVKIFNNLKNSIDNDVRFLESSQELKKGLMQKLLTGKIRIKV